MCAVTCLEPGVATVELPGWVILGAPLAATDGRLRSTAERLGEVIPTFVTTNLRGARWTKLIANLANGLSAATGLSIAELGRSRSGRTLAIRVMREGHRVARAAGVGLDRHIYGLGMSRGNSSVLAVLQGTVTSLLPTLPESISAAILSLVGRSSLGRANFRGSTWQSLARGRTTEIDFLNGEIVRLGAAIGVDTPYNTRVLEAVHAAERTKRCVRLSELWPNAR
jgi:2-dehydropantoate 2-reductase